MNRPINAPARPISVCTKYGVYAPIKRHIQTPAKPIQYSCAPSPFRKANKIKITINAGKNNNDILVCHIPVLLLTI